MSYDGKVTVRLLLEQSDRLDDAFKGHWGKRDPVFRRFAEAFLEAYEECGDALIDGIIDGTSEIAFV